MHSLQLFRAYYIRWSEKQQLTCENWYKEKCLTNAFLEVLLLRILTSAPANVFVLEYITIILLSKKVFLFVHEMLLVICAYILYLKFLILLGFMNAFPYLQWKL